MTFMDWLNVGYFGYNFGMPENWNTAYLIIGAIICSILAYLVGSINCGVILSKEKYGADIREKGSKNAGATNMLRIYGKRAAILTFLGDVLKSVVASVIGRLFFGYLGAFLAGLFCIIGHAYPIFFKFKGGKGVVAISTMCLLTNPVVFLIMLLIFIVILYGFKMVSLASIMIMVIYPFVLFNVGYMGPGFHVVIGAIGCLFVIFLHRTNIARIFNHEESKISFGKKNGSVKQGKSSKIKVKKCDGCGADVTVIDGVGTCKYCGKNIYE